MILSKRINTSCFEIENCLMVMAPGMAKSECPNWRTDGCCSFGDKCKYTHTKSLRNDKYGLFYLIEWQHSSLIPKSAELLWRPTREKLSVKDRKEVEAQNVPIKEKVEAFDLASMQLPAPPGPVITTWKNSLRWI